MPQPAHIIPLQVTRTDIQIRPNNTRVLYRPFEPPTPQRAMKIIGRIMELADDVVAAILQAVLAEFHGRHQRLLNFFEARFEAVKHHLLTDRPLTESQRLVIGSFFTQEYALESAAALQSVDRLASLPG